jgi:hypothetical protein
MFMCNDVGNDDKGDGGIVTDDVCLCNKGDPLHHNSFSTAL